MAAPLLWASPNPASSVNAREMNSFRGDLCRNQAENGPEPTFINRFQSGRTADKFAGIEEIRSDNGLRFLPQYINAFFSLKVEDYVDLDTHGMFICSIVESRVITNVETMTYTYYQDNVKPKPETEGKKGYVCKVCGYVYEGDELPEDFVCPLCKHGAADFEPI